MVKRAERFHIWGAALLHVQCSMFNVVSGVAAVRAAGAALKVRRTLCDCMSASLRDAESPPPHVVAARNRSM